MSGQANWDIYRVLPDGSGLQQLTFDGGSWHPAWSPDGRWITFVSQRSGVWKLYRMRADGREVSTLATVADARSLRAPSWSPDGQWIVFLSLEAGAQYLYRIQMDEDGRAISAPQRVTDVMAYNSDVSWSPDSREFVAAFSVNGFASIFRVDAATGNMQRLTNVSGSTEWSPNWSPDGEWIVFTSDRRDENNVYRMRPDGSDVQLVDDTQTFDFDPNWAPDGERLLMSVRDGRGFALYEMHPDGSERRRVLDLYDNEVAPRYSPFIDLAWNAMGLIVLSAAILLVRRMLQKLPQSIARSPAPPKQHSP